MAIQTLTRRFFSLILTKVDCASDNGFGHNYVWAGSLDSALRLAENHKKPVMVIIHKTWCPACKKLKPQFAQSPEIQSLSKSFVMVNLADDEEPQSPQYSPDGNYIPRILFISPGGNLDHEIINDDGSSQHKYFYNRPEQIVKSMQRVLDKYNIQRFEV